MEEAEEGEGRTGSEKEGVILCTLAMSILG